MTFITQQEATFNPISDTGACVYSLTKDVDLTGMTYDIIVNITKPLVLTMQFFCLHIYIYIYMINHLYVTLKLLKT